MLAATSLLSTGDYIRQSSHNLLNYDSFQTQCFFSGLVFVSCYSCCYNCVVISSNTLHFLQNLSLKEIIFFIVWSLSAALVRLALSISCMLENEEWIRNKTICGWDVILTYAWRTRIWWNLQVAWMEEKIMKFKLSWLVLVQKILNEGNYTPAYFSRY